MSEGSNQFQRILSIKRYLNQDSMYYVYILKSLTKDWRYVGFTSDLRKRLNQHNQGMVDSTRHFKPYKMVSYLAVEKKDTAVNLEKYFKTGSDIAWMSKRLLDQ